MIIYQYRPVHTNEISINAICVQGLLWTSFCEVQRQIRTVHSLWNSGTFMNFDFRIGARLKGRVCHVSCISHLVNNGSYGPITGPIKPNELEKSDLTLYKGKGAKVLYY